MKKLLLLIILLLPCNVLALSLPKTYSKNVLIYDKTEDKILYEVNSEEITPIASLTKIMTTITAIEEIKDINVSVKVEKYMIQNIDWITSVAGLKPGDIVSYRDLLFASMLPSGADATQVLAYSLCGSIDAFVSKMNELAKKIGMDNSHFTNVAGLDNDNHYSNLQDILKLLNYALNNDLFKEVYTTREYTLTNGLKVESTILTYNKYMNIDTSKIIGSKTGLTDNAGLCISVLFESNNHEFIIITTKANYRYHVYNNLKDAILLINFIEQNYNNQTLIKKGTLLTSIDILFGKEEKYPIKAQNDIIKFLPNDYDKNLASYSYKGVKQISPSTKVGTKLGSIQYFYNNELIKEEDIFLDKKVNISIKKVIKKYWYIIAIILCWFIIKIIKTIKKRLIILPKRKN